MQISTPAPAGAMIPPPAAPAKAPTGAPATPTKPVPAGAAPGGAGQAEGQPDPAAAKAAMIDKLMNTSATDAIASVDAGLAKVATLTVGGGTPEGSQNAKLASSLLTDSSMMLQHAHTQALEQIRTLAAELHIKLMSAATGLAFMGGQVALASQSKQPVKLAEMAAGPIAETKATIADVVAALDPKAPAAQGAPAASGAGSGAAPGGPPVRPPGTDPDKHLEGPGVGPGPHPA